jgi:hypothetical protein
MEQTSGVRRDVTLDAYDPHVFDQLNPFRNAKRLLAYGRCHIPDIGDVFLRHNVHELFGLSLLHKHFDLYPDEMLLRTIDRQRRVAYTRPGRKRADAMPYLWRILPGIQGQWRVVPLEAQTAGEKEERTADVQQHRPFLADLAEALAGLGLMDLFGVATLGLSSIPLGRDEILVETTDAARRVLTHTPEERGNVRIEELTETLWVFTPGTRIPDLGGVYNCKMHCVGHCHAHCYAHCKNHPEVPEEVMVLPGAAPVVGPGKAPRRARRQRPAR